MTMTPAPGFDPLLVSWGAPDQPRTTTCSYCSEPLPEDGVPLILWNSTGWCAEFCESCQQKWWGMEPLTDNDEPESGL